MADEQKLGMSLDDIIKKDKVSKKGSGGAGKKGGLKATFKTGGRGGKTTRGRGGARGARRGAGVARGGRLGNRAIESRLSKVKETNRIKRALNIKSKRGGINTRLGQRRRQNALIAKLIAQRSANRRQPITRRNNLNTRNVVNKLLKRAVNTRSRIAQSRINRNPSNILRVSQALKILQQAQGPRFSGRLGTRGRGAARFNSARSPGISNAMLNRLGGRGRGASALRRNNRVQLTNSARGRGLAAREAHMDAERRLRGQRQLQIRQQRQLARQQQIIDQRERALQRLQQQQSQRFRTFNARGRGGLRGGFGGGRGRGAFGNNIKNLIQDTVYQAVAQASTALQRREAALPRRQPGMLRMDQYDIAERRQPAYRMRAQPLYDDRYEERIQSRPMRRSAASGGGLRAWSNEYENTPMRQAFAGSSSGARTLDERFGGGPSRISVAGSRQYLF